MLIAELTEIELKSQLAKELDKLNKAQLLAAHQFIARIIAEELSDAVTQDWERGIVNRAAIQKAIDEYRAKHPYGAV